MIPIIPLGGQGITSGVYVLMGLIDAHPSELVNVAKVTDGNDRYSFIALFREKNTIGSFVAFINEWGTSDNHSGTGGQGFKNMVAYLEKNDIEPLEWNLSLIEDDFLETFGPGSKKKQTLRLQGWQEIVSWMCCSISEPYFDPRYQD